MTPAVEQTHGKYLGFRLAITDHTVTVYRLDGRLIGTSASMSGARRLIKGYRRSDRA